MLGQETEACSNISMAFRERSSPNSGERQRIKVTSPLQIQIIDASESSQALVIKYFATMTLIGQDSDVVGRAWSVALGEWGRAGECPYHDVMS